MSERYSIERCKENFHRAVKKALAMKFDSMRNNAEEFPVEYGRKQACYRERYHGLLASVMGAQNLAAQPRIRYAVEEPEASSWDVLGKAV